VEFSLWLQCVQSLRDLLTQQDFNQWISPLQAEETGEGLMLYAPNQYVLEGVGNKYLPLIEQEVNRLGINGGIKVSIQVGAKVSKIEQSGDMIEFPDSLVECHQDCLNEKYTFENFVEGKSNQFARATAMQVAENPGRAYNPLFLYGGVGLGKTHLMHAVGNLLIKSKPGSKAVYLHSERFVSDMVKSLQNNSIGEFKRRYRSVDALLLDDIQFFAGKERSQEEFFHTFNALLEGHQQIILTSDRYPKEIIGIEERLKSRFGSGLTVAVQPPDLETRVAILMNKAEQFKIPLLHNVAFFIAKRIRSNVRELEGALKRISANANFTGNQVTLDFVQEALKDLLAVQEKLVTVDGVIRAVSEYFSVRVSEILSKRRNRAVARPRQIAMSLCKEFTELSLPEIGEAFGGRDHTTVLHACKQVKQLCEKYSDISEDYLNLQRLLST